MEILPPAGDPAGRAIPRPAWNPWLGGSAIAPGFGSDHLPSNDHLQGESQGPRSSVAPSAAAIPGASLRSLASLHWPGGFSEKNSCKYFMVIWLFVPAATSLSPTGSIALLFVWTYYYRRILMEIKRGSSVGNGCWVLIHARPHTE